MIERYPSLMNRDRAHLSDVTEIQQISKNAIIVATDDMCYSDIGYNLSLFA